MNARVESFPVHACRIRDVAFAAIAETCPVDEAAGAGAEMTALHRVAATVRRTGRTLRQALEEAVRRPSAEDERLVALAAELRLTAPELLAVAIAASVEDDPLAGRVLAHVQSPFGGSRPTVGLLTHALGRALDAGSVVPMLLDGAALRSGLLVLLNDTAPLPERSVMVPAPTFLAMSGHDGAWPGVTTAEEARDLPLPATAIAEAERHAAALRAGHGRVLVVRTGSPREGRSVAAAIASALGRRAAFVDGDVVSGLAPWLLLRRLVPVFCWDLVPGERRRLPVVPGYAGPILVVCGPDGSIDTLDGTAAIWTLALPAQPERRTLWAAALGYGTPEAIAEQLSTDYLHGAGRIAAIGRLAHHHAALAGRALPDREDAMAAASSSDIPGLDALAQPLRASVADEALVAAPELQAELESLVLRCRMRENLSAGLGPSLRTRYRTGVRALFTGPSGTGKTLAAGWLATRLGLPLLRVDLASVTSKYIGETEKNLSQLLARAEQADVILLFDEADSLFGRRTDIRDANDRFANAQTNYLLQRIETYDGIVVLTSNSQARFDEAFARRLDFVVEFPAPGPEERRALWYSHLGPHTQMRPAEINHLAVLLDFNGGHIRNIVLRAAARARRDGRDVDFSDLLSGIAAECSKLGRQVPVELSARV